MWEADFVEFGDALEQLGFRPRDERTVGADGAVLHTAQPNPFMTYMVHAFPDGSSMFTWEFALGEYLASKGIQMGSDETLNQFIYPRRDLRGPQEAAWLIGAIEQTESMLSAIRLDRPVA